MPLTLFSGRGLALLRGMALWKLPSSDACRKKAMIVAVAVVVIAGELVLSLYLIISISTYAELREQRARGRNVSDPNATSGHEPCASHRPTRRRTRHCCWRHLGSYPYRICRCRCRCRCRCLCLFSSHCEPSTVTGLSRVKPQLQPSAAATAARVASSSKSEGKVKPHLQQSAAATAARVATEARVITAARVATATTCTSGEGSLLRSIPRS